MLRTMSVLRDRAKAFARTRLRQVLAVSPPLLQHAIRTAAELAVYRFKVVDETLPPIFHYWSNTYLRPSLERLGYSSPDGFFFKRIVQHARERSSVQLRILSIGAGRCEAEIELAEKLRHEGVSAIKFLCVDINEGALRQARATAARRGLDEMFAFSVTDAAAVPCDVPFDVVIANQCLHHFVNLDHVLDRVHQCLAEDGVLVTCDVIGRNGHQLWPEALEEVEAMWRKLPRKYHYDRTLGAIRDEYVNYDHSDVAFEGIRAQEVLPRLLDRFHFEIFMPYACIVLPFVERRFGFNFDPDSTFDRAFIDEVAARDASLIREGTIKPTQLLASLRKHAVDDCVCFDDRLTPERCLRPIA